MHLYKSWSLVGLCAALGAACGEPVDTSGASASEAGGDTSGTSGQVVTTTGVDPSAGSTTGDGSGSESNGMTTTSGTTGSTEATSAGTTAGTTAGTDGETTTSTTTGVQETTGGDDTTTAGTTDTTGGDTGNNDECVLAMMHEPCDAMSNDALHALGLNCTSLGGNFQDGINAVKVSNISFQAPPEMQGKRTWQVAKSYGTYIDPMTNAPFWNSREGDKVLLISSGLLPAPDANGAVVVDDGDVYNDAAFGGQWDSDSMPPPMSPQKGSPDPNGFTNCDDINDCSNTLLDQWNLGNGDAEDKMWFSFQVKAPALADGDQADAKGYTFDFAYFSAEFPEFVDSEYNDIFVVWQASEDYTGNVTFINEQPLTVTALWPIDFEGECEFLDPNCTGADPHLEGTGYILDGGATGWYKATSGVKPGETFTLAFAVFDMGDSTYDTTAILDNWMWDCEGCVPNEVNSCGIEPQ